MSPRSSSRRADGGKYVLLAGLYSLPRLCLPAGKRELDLWIVLNPACMPIKGFAAAQAV
jgi:hypothetical protein